ncbi:MAG: DUF4258 domain-containing protein [Methanobacterium sp.]|jgi:hypothetical protein
MNDIDLENVPPTLAATSKKQIIFTYHALEKMYDRELAESWIIDSLINQKPQGILKQDLNKFRMYYVHPAKDGYDLIIVIAIVNSPEKVIRVVTTYEQNEKVRVRK